MYFEEPEELLSVLVQYEWVFWGTVGVMVVTGIGNLGALGAPGPRTRWGTVLSIKLLVVLLFVVGSFLRTLTVFRLYERESLSPANSALQRWYGATAWTLVGVVALAEFLAHG